jgi:hypothetical protein
MCAFVLGMKSEDVDMSIEALNHVLFLMPSYVFVCILVLFCAFFCIYACICICVRCKQYTKIFMQTVCMHACICMYDPHTHTIPHGMWQHSKIKHCKPQLTSKCVSKIKVVSLLMKVYGQIHVPAARQCAGNGGIQGAFEHADQVVVKKRRRLGAFRLFEKRGHIYGDPP